MLASPASAPNQSPAAHAAHAPRQDTTNGLNHLLNRFVDAAFKLALSAPADCNLSSPDFAFLWAVGREGYALDVSAGRGGLAREGPGQST